MLKRIIGTCVLALLASAALADNPRVLLSTSHGDIEIELDAEAAPITVENFLRYTDAGHYDGTIFHRVIPGFMIQGGGFDSKMQQQDTRPAIKNEANNGLRNDRGTVAMARTSAPHSATMQFFINHADNDFLNHSSRDFGYAVFATVVRGMPIVDQIAQVTTGSYQMHQNVPVEPVLIQSIKRVE